MTEIYFSHFWRLEIQDQGASKVGFILKPFLLAFGGGHLNNLERAKEEGGGERRRGVKREGTGFLVSPPTRTLILP